MRNASPTIRPRPTSSIGTRYEQDNPDTFITMYEFWLQKPGTLPR